MKNRGAGSLLRCGCFAMAFCAVLLIAVGASLAATVDGVQFSQPKVYQENNFRNGKTVRVGIPQNPPIVMHGNGGPPRGFVPDLIRDVARTRGWNLQYVEVPWAELLKMLDSGKIDILAGIAYTPARAKKYNMSREAVANNWAIVYRSKNTVIDSIADIVGKRVAMIPGNVHSVALMTLSRSFGYSFETIPAASYANALELVDSGKADVAIVARTFHMMHGSEYQALATTVRFDPVELRFGAPKGAGNDLLSAIDTYILTQEDDPSSHYNQLLDKWFKGPVKEVIPVWFYWAIGGAIVLVGLAWLVVIWLRHEVRVRTGALKESEQRFRDFSESTSDWLWEMDPDLRFSFFSDRFSEITGVAMQGLLGKTRAESGLDIEDEQVRRNIADLEAHRPFKNFEHHRFRSDGRVIHMSASGAPVFDKDGAFKGYRGTGTDITGRIQAQEGLIRSRDELEMHVYERTRQLREEIEERKAIEEALLDAKDVAEKANKAKSEFLASMSHELRTPLNAILGFSQLLQMNPKQPLSPTQMEHVEHIRTGGGHLLELINEVLDLAKIEADGARLFPEILAINETVADCVEMMVPLAASQEIQIVDRFSAGPSAVLRTDPLRFKQVLLNLISNAVKYNRTGGTVTVEGRSEDGFLRLSVTDTGVGIAQDDFAGVFQMFLRLGKDPKLATEGTGIGLTVTKLLVEQMAGRIGFESEQGVGSTFWFELPLVSNQEVLIWTEDLNIGIEAIDEDHKNVISLLNELSHLLFGDADVEGVIEKLIDGSDLHFRREETIMELVGDPNLELHRGSHREIIGRLDDLAAKWRAAPDAETLHPLRKLLREWWIDHIRNVDNTISQYAEGKEAEIHKILEDIK